MQLSHYKSTSKQTTIIPKLIFTSTIRTWNTLDFNIREVPTFFTFQKRLHLNILEISQVTDTVMFCKAG